MAPRRAATALAVVSAATGAASAHGFGQRYDLPVPLHLYMGGAGAAVLLSFVIIGLFVRGAPKRHSYRRFDLLRWRLPRFLATHGPFVLGQAGALLFLLVVAAALAGNQHSERNLAPTVIWVIWWVGLAYVSALLGNVWPFLNPWRALFAGAEFLYRRIAPGGRLSLGRPYPARLGMWPAFGLFLGFAWLELVYPGNSVPWNLGVIAIAYSLVTWAGMFVYGREIWLRHGEPFTLVFGLLSRFAMTELRVTDSRACLECPLECRDADGECVNCHECFEAAAEGARQWNIRPFAVGLLRNEPVPPSLMAFVLLVLSTVTFDGFTATPLWAAIRSQIYYYLSTRLGGSGGNHLVFTDSLGLMTFVALFFGVYFLFCGMMAVASGGRAGSALLARKFAFSLVPISLAYHLAHYYSYLLIQGQLVIPLLSDPFGSGRNLLGTADYTINIGIVGARSVWFTAVIAIVLGHIVAVYLAHIVAFRVFVDKRPALRSQYPMLVLMVAYTMISLWILAQPVIESTPAGG